MDLKNNTIRGQCHCGNITLLFTVSKPIDQLFVRHCTCEFCDENKKDFNNVEEISYEGEEIDDRLTRRKSRWTPASLKTNS